MTLIDEGGYFRHKQTMTTPFNPREFVERQGWTFAKKYAETAPHEYIVRGIGNSDEDFDAMVRFIRANADERVWPATGSRGRIYLYLYAPDGRRYWTMGWPVAETTIINRDENDPSRELEPGENVRYSSPDGKRPQCK